MAGCVVVMEEIIDRLGWILCGALALLLLTVWGMWRWRRGRAARNGRRGEKRVSRELRRLRKRSNILIDDLLIADKDGRTVQIDHILLSTRGVFVIETKSHKGRISGSEHSQYWQQKLWMQTRSFYNPLLQNATHIRLLSKLLPGVEPVSVVVFTEASRLEIEADDIVEHRTLLRDKHTSRTFNPEESVSRSWWRRRKAVVLDESKIVTRLQGLRNEIKRRDCIYEQDEIELLATRLRELNDKSRKSRRDHTRYAREAASKSSRLIRQGVCPRCGSALAIRKGTHGEFLGCTAYPSCRFTSQL